MIKIFLYIIFVIIAVAVFSWALDLEGFTVMVIEGQRVDISTSVLFLAAAGALFLFFFGGVIMSWLAGLPGMLRRRASDRKRARGMVALTRGLEAVAAGDAADAQRFARTASKTLAEPALTRLLTAQAAQIAGDALTAGQSYTAMLESPETEFLGLRGLYMQATEAGEMDDARSYAERAFRLRPGTHWAFESVLKLSLERGAWGDALEALTLARQHKIADGIEHRRMEAALLTAQAYASRDSDDDETGLKDADAALKKAPTITPAAALAAEIEVEAGHRSKAAKFLGDAWEAEPHPGLAAVMRRIFEHERGERVQGRLIKLTERVPEHPESRLLLAEVQLEGGEPEAAQTTLEPLLTGRPNKRMLQLMADITAERYSAEAAAEWKARADRAPIEVIPGVDGSFHYTTEGWRRLIREFSEFGRLAPPPLEVETPEIAADEVRALLAPPPVVEEDPAEEVEEEAAEEPAAPEAANDSSDDEPEASTDEATEANGEPDAPSEADEDETSKPAEKAQ